MAQQAVVEEAVVRAALAALRDALGERLVAVVLFGSRARGDAKAGSDWDLLVLADGLPENPFDRSVSSSVPCPHTVAGPFHFWQRLPRNSAAA